MATFVHTLNHNWLGEVDVAVTTSLLAACFFLIGIGLWSRYLEGSGWQGKGWMIIVAIILMVGRYAVELTMILMCGLGLPTTIMAQIGGTNGVVKLNKLTYAGDLLCMSIVVLTQLSILHYLLFKVHQRGIRWLTYGLMALCFAVWIARLTAVAVICAPNTEAFKETHLEKRLILHLCSNISEIVLDGSILLLSLQALYTMRLSWARTFGLGMIYILGLGIIAIIAVRIKLDLDLDLDPDPSYSTHRMALKSLLSSIVSLLGIIIACLPTLLSAIQTVFRTSIFSSPSEEPASELIHGCWKPRETVWDTEYDPDMPLCHPPMAKKLSELANGQIKIIFNWDIHSARNSARLTRNSMPIQ